MCLPAQIGFSGSSNNFTLIFYNARYAGDKISDLSLKDWALGVPTTYLSGIPALQSCPLLADHHLGELFSSNFAVNGFPSNDLLLKG